MNELEVKCGVMSLAKIGREKDRRHGLCAISMSQFVPLFQNDVLIGLKYMRAEKVHQGLGAGFVMPLSYPENRLVYHMFRWGLQIPKTRLYMRTGLATSMRY